jgi:ADP-heptose:LPS heptosyltransferase
MTNLKKQTKFLIIPRPHVGDFIWATSAVALLKKHEPSSDITVIAPENITELIKGNRIFDKVLTYDLTLFESRKILIKAAYRFILFFKLLLSLRRCRFDASFLLSPFPLFIKLLPFIKADKTVFSIYECCGYGQSSNESVFLNKYLPKDKLFPVEIPKDSDRTHRSEIYQTLVRKYLNSSNISLPVIPDISGEDRTDSLIKTEKLKKVAICMQPSRTSRNVWPDEYLLKTINAISQKTSAAFFMLGGNDISGSFTILKSKLNEDIEIHDLYGKTSILELKELLNKCDLLISVDTGTLHVAAMTKIAIISLFGMTHPDSVVPMSPRNITLYSAIDCSPCVFKSTFLKQPCPYETRRCMELIKPESVIQHALRVLENKK